MLVGGGENIAGNIARGMIRGEAREQRRQALMAELLLIGIFSLVNAIGGEQDNVARLKLHGSFLVLDFRKETQGHSIHATLQHCPLAHEKGIGPAGVCEGKTARTSIVNREDQSDEARV